MWVSHLTSLNNNGRINLNPISYSLLIFEFSLSLNANLLICRTWNWEIRFGCWTPAANCVRVKRCHYIVVLTINFHTITSIHITWLPESAIVLIWTQNHVTILCYTNNLLFSLLNWYLRYSKINWVTLAFLNIIARWGDLVPWFYGRSLNARRKTVVMVKIICTITSHACI